ncbi:helix-turn-helix domain-containing protein [Marinomonas agarivorans]|nr:helix-turn-helix domain-containing protein [Marinomonas agarivorans]
MFAMHIALTILAGMKTQLAINIRKRMREMKLTQLQLAQIAGVSQVTIHKLINGKIINSSRIVDLAKALETRPEWLQYGVGEPKAEYTVDTNIKTRMFPLITEAQAARWSKKTIERIHKKALSWEITSSDPSSNAFWLTVNGNSMSTQSGTSIPDGYNILVDASKKAKHGDLVVAKRLPDSQILFKQLIIDSGEKYLKPLNEAYKLIEFDEELHQIIGVVLEANLKLA